MTVRENRTTKLAEEAALREQPEWEAYCQGHYVHSPKSSTANQMGDGDRHEIAPIDESAATSLIGSWDAFMVGAL